MQRRASGLFTVVFRRERRFGEEVVAKGKVAPDRDVASLITMQLRAAFARGRVCQGAIPSTAETVFAMPSITQPLKRGSSFVQPSQARCDSKEIENRLGSDARYGRRSDMMDHQYDTTRGAPNAISFNPCERWPA
jgi:hypothetical protein